MFIHYSIEEQWGRFHILAIVNSAIMNLHLQVFVWVPVLGYLGYIPRNRIAGSYGNSIVNFWELPVHWVSVWWWKLSRNLSLIFILERWFSWLHNSAFYMYYSSSFGFNCCYYFHLISFLSVWLFWLFSFSVFQIFCLWCDTNLLLLIIFYCYASNCEFLIFNSIHYVPISVKSVKD